MCERNLRDQNIKPGVWCDPCLAPIVYALNDSPEPVRTVASCCGHGERLGSIALADGRQLVIVPNLEALGRLSALPTLIAGANAPEGE